MPSGIDLFGQPLIEPRPQGRPRHVPTGATRQLARELCAQGVSQPGIAKAIGLTVPTLVLHYHQEIGSKSNAWRSWAQPEGTENGRPMD